MKKDNYGKWTSKQLHRQFKNLNLAIRLLAGILLVIFALTIYKSIKEGRINPLLISPIALSIIIPLNFKRIRDIREEIQRREQEH